MEKLELTISYLMIFFQKYFVFKIIWSFELFTMFYLHNKIEKCSAVMFLMARCKEENTEAKSLQGLVCGIL